MNWKTALNRSVVWTTITMFVTAVFLALLNFSGGTAFRITEISIPFVFFGINLLFRAFPCKAGREKIRRLTVVCANLALTAVYAVLLLKL